MISIIRRLILLQEKRKFHLIIIFLFTLFVGIIRALEELLFFQTPIGIRNVITYCAFYFFMAIGLSIILHKINRIKWEKVINAIFIGIFLGIFPPVLDLIFSGRPEKFYYFYYQLDYEHIPFFFIHRKIIFLLANA